MDEDRGFGQVTKIRLRTPATTSNLGPGFDVLGLALNLHNRMTIEETTSGELKVEVIGEGAGEIPTDETNIVYQAMLRVFQKVGYEPAGLDIVLENRIPITRGLGSSAAARIGALVGANLISGAGLSEGEILDIGLQLEGHPDNVAPALVGGLVASSSEDGHVRYIRIDPPSGVKTVLAVPEFELLTRKAREVLPHELRLEDAVYNLSHTALVMAALATGDLGSLRFAMQDRLHQPYREKLIPGMRKIFEAALEAGALGVALSGAGPTILAFAQEDSISVGGSMQRAWRGLGIRSKVLVLDMDGQGTVIEQMADG